MDVLVAETAGRVVSTDAQAERDWEARLAKATGLAFRVSMSVLRQREDAEDVAQETVLRAFRGFGRLREPDRLDAWLVRVAWRLSISRLRSAARRERLVRAAALEQPETSPEDLAASLEFQRRLALAMDELPAKLRVIVILAAVEGRDTREVAAIVGVPEGTVKSRLFLARKRLAEKLEWTANSSAKS